MEVLMRVQESTGGGRIAFALLFLSFAALSGCAFLRDFDEFSFKSGDAGDGAPTDCVPSPEVCNGIDDDCNGLIDDEPLACALPNASETVCLAGSCALVSCEPDHDDCFDHVPGCETRIRDSHAHCGRCHSPCGPSEVCDEGKCRLVRARWGAFLHGPAAVLWGAAGDDLLLSFPSSGSHTVIGSTGEETARTVQVGTEHFVYRLGPDGRFSEPFILQSFESKIQITAMTGDSAGNVYLVGSYAEPVLPLTPEYILPVPAEGRVYAFIIALSPDMKARWARAFVGSSSKELFAVKLSPTGKIIVGGRFTEDLVFLEHDYSGDADQGLFAALLAKNGDSIDAFALMNDAAPLGGFALAVDPLGQSYVSRLTNGHFTVGDRLYDGERRRVIAALDSNLELLWSRALVEASAIETYGLSIDAGPNGDLLVATGSTLELSWGGEALEPGAHLARLSGNAGGKHLWSRSFPDVARLLHPRIHRDGHGYVMGDLSGATLPDLGGGPLSVPSVPDTLIASFDSEGRYRWGKVMGGAGDEKVAHLAVHPSGDITSVGSHTASFTLDEIEVPFSAPGRWYHIFRFSE